MSLNWRASWCNYFLLGLALIYFLQTSSRSTLSADIFTTTPPYTSPLYKTTYSSDKVDDWQLILDKSWTLVHTLTYLPLGSHWTVSGAVWRHRKFLSTDVLLVIEYTCNTDLSAGKFFTFRQTPTRFNWVSFFGYRQNGRKVIARRAGTVLFTATARAWRWKLRSSNCSNRRALLYSAICVCMWTDVHSTAMIRFRHFAKSA